MHPRLGSATMLQPVFPREGNWNLPWEKSHWDNNTVVKFFTKFKRVKSEKKIKVIIMVTSLSLKALNALQKQGKRGGDNNFFFLSEVIVLFR